MHAATHRTVECCTARRSCQIAIKSVAVVPCFDFLDTRTNNNGKERRSHFSFTGIFYRINSPKTQLAIGVARTHQRKRFLATTAIQEVMHESDTKDLS
jgi:hypothetical protein